MPRGAQAWVKPQGEAGDPDPRANLIDLAAYRRNRATRSTAPATRGAQRWKGVVLLWVPVWVW